jgi:hypothetical protein
LLNPAGIELAVRLPSRIRVRPVGAERDFDRARDQCHRLVRQVSVQARQVSVPRPDAMLAAMAAVAAVAGGR